MESLNAFLKEILLAVTSRGGGKGTPEGQVIELLFQAISRGLLYKEMPRWREVEGLGALQIQHYVDVAREYLGRNVGESVFYSHATTGGGKSLLLRTLFWSV